MQILWNWARAVVCAWVIASPAFPQQTDTAAAEVANAIPAVEPAIRPVAPIDKRAFGFLPNYRLVELSTPFQPITARRKFYIAAKDTFDYPVFFTSAFFSGVAQLRNQNPSFGQGTKGYAHRYALGYVDQVIGNFLGEAVLPAALHLDPRYYRKGEGSIKGRIWWATTRVFVTRTDRGNWTFNYQEWLGTSAGVAISNIYYPETRTAKLNANMLGFQVSVDALNNLLKEFWPDIKKGMSRRKSQP